MTEPLDNYIARTSFGLEEVLAAELRALGAQDITLMTRAVAFSGDKELLYTCNLHLRTCLNIVKPIITLPVATIDDLYKQAMTVNWRSVMSINQTFMINVVANHETITHTQYAAQKVKDAVADRFRKDFDARPSVDTENPDIRIFVYVGPEQTTFYLDSSGDKLYKRGYRVETTSAPINEVLAAGMLQLSKWDKQKPLLDLMCGSGTLLIEAAMLALNYPAGINRNDFGFKQWKDYDETLWKKVKQNAMSQIIEKELEIVGCDISPYVIEKAQQNIEEAGLEHLIKIKKSSFEAFTHTYSEGLIITNPPYGEKITPEDVNALYKSFGDTLKKQYNGFEAWLITSNPEALKSVGLRTSAKIKLFNGALECRFCKYELYAGSKKQKFNEAPLAE